MKEIDAMNESEIKVNGSNNIEQSTFFIYNSSSTHIEGVHKPVENATVFIGKTKGNPLNFTAGIMSEKVVNLFFRAINNRTVERNYFRLYSEMLEGSISEDEYYAAIKENEDDYVLKNDEMPTREELLAALSIASKVKDVENSEDLSSLFSFNSETVDKMLTEI